MTNQELINTYMQSKEKKEEFALILCNYLNKEIQEFWENNQERNELFIYVFYDESDDGIKYQLEIVKDLYPDTLCIHLFHDNKVINETISNA